MFSFLCVIFMSRPNSAEREADFLSENSYFLQLLFLIDDKALTVVGNAYSLIPHLKRPLKKARREIIQDLLSTLIKTKTIRSAV